MPDRLNQPTDGWLKGNPIMKNMIAIIAALGFCHAAVAKEARIPSSKEDISWQYFSPGVAEGTRANGEILRSFQGKEAIGAILLEKRKDLREALALESHENIDALSRLVDDLELAYQLSQPLAARIGDAKVAIQTIEIEPHVPQICHFRNQGQSIFTSYPYAMWDTPTVTANSPGFGTGPLVGPFPPPPLSTFRSVYVELKSGSLPALTDYDSSAVSNAAIEAYQIMSGVQNCQMKTVHLFSATCYNSTVDSAVLTIEQTCHNVWSNTPPIITVD